MKKLIKTALVIHLLLACALISLGQFGRPAAAKSPVLGVTPTATEVPPDPPAPVHTPTPVFTPITPAPTPTSTPVPTSTSPGDKPDPSSQANIRIVKSANPMAVLPGGQVIFNIQICNESGQAAENVVVSDALAPELVLVRATASQGRIVVEGNGMRAELGALAAEACAQVTVTARVRADVPSGTQIRNVASVGPLYDDVDITTMVLLPESGTSTVRGTFVGILALGVFVGALGLAWRTQKII